MPTWPDAPPPPLFAIVPFSEIAFRVIVLFEEPLTTCTPAPKLSVTTQRSTRLPLPPSRRPAVAAAAPEPRPLRRTVTFVTLFEPVLRRASIPLPSVSEIHVSLIDEPRLASIEIAPRAGFPIALPRISQPVTVQPSEPAESVIALPADHPSRLFAIVPAWTPETCTRSPPARSAAPGSAHAAAVAPSTHDSIRAPEARLPTRTQASAPLPGALPKPVTAMPATAWLAPCRSSPIARPAPSRISTSGPGTGSTFAASVPAVMPPPSETAFVLPMFAVCVPPSTCVPGSVSAGSAVSGTKRATPAVSWFARPARRPGCASPSPTMKTLVSEPAGRPACARPAFPSAFALSRNCRSVPCPASRVLTIVSKL